MNKVDADANSENQCHLDVMKMQCQTSISASKSNALISEARKERAVAFFF